jgi:hypothetical protein
MQIASDSNRRCAWRRRLTCRDFQLGRPLSDGPPSGKSEDTFMRTLIILSVVVPLKIEQELTRRLVKRAVPRRHRTGSLRH